MARTSRKGLDYFPMDIDIFNDLKIRKLIKYQGGKAITVYALLLCDIYKNGYYMEWDKELPFICSELTGFDEAYISEVIKACLTLGLFSNELFETKKVLTSRGIQERYSHICAQCKRKNRLAEYNLLVPDKDDSTAEEQVEATPIPPSPPPQYEPYTLTLDQEIETMKREDIWLDQIQMLHSMDIEKLRSCLDDFKVQCLADGKERHQSLSDAKSHFNSWLRIVNIKERNKDEKNRPNSRNQRRANLLNADEPKTYSNSF